MLNVTAGASFGLALFTVASHALLARTTLLGAWGLVLAVLLVAALVLQLQPAQPTSASRPESPAA